MRWEPDTCGCVFEDVDWDAGTATTIRACPDHAGLSGNAHFAVVYQGENYVKNMALGDVAEAAPQLFWTAAEARQRNEAQLLAWMGTATPRQRQLIAALSDEGLSAEMSRHQLTPTVAGAPMPGVSVTHRFKPSAPGQPRTLEITCHALSPQEKAAVRAKHARFSTKVEIV